MNIIGVFAHHKVAANLLMILMIMSGIFALNKLNIQFFPTFELDRISVRVVWSGASAEDIEKGITIPLEQLLKTVENLDSITSTSAQNISSIQLEFEEDTDLLIALDKVKQKVDEFRNLPKEAETPVVETLTRYETVAKVQVSQQQFDSSSSSPIQQEPFTHRELRNLVDGFEKDLIKRGINKVVISGLPEEEIAIELSNEQLINLNLSLADIAQQIKDNSLDQPVGTIARYEHAKEIRALEQKRQVIDFEKISITDSSNINQSSKQGDELSNYIQLGDIAQIEKRPVHGQVNRMVQGQPVVELLLQRTENGNALDAAKIMQAWLKDMESIIPPNIKLTVYDESWKLIKDRTLLLLQNGLGGLFLVVLILYLFLNGKVALWVAIGIPVSFMATLAILYLFGGTINMISLFGLIMALGIIVDDAIVVGEDALSHYQEGEAALTAAEGGANRMFMPVFAASLTTVAAFLPLMMIGGIMGNILFDIPLIIICVIIASLIESFFILPGHLKYAFLSMKKPMLYTSDHNQVNPIDDSNTASNPSATSNLSNNKKEISFRHSFDAKFNHFRDVKFRRFIQLTIEYRSITMALSFSIFVLAIAMLVGGRIGYSFFPSPESTTVYANVGFVSGTPREKTTAYLKHMEDTLYETEQELGEGLIDTAITIVGTSFSGGQGGKSGEQLGAIYLQLQQPDQRSVRNEQFIQLWKSKIKQKNDSVLAAGIETFTINSRKSGPPGTDISVRLQGASNEQLKLAANELSQVLKNTKGVYAIDNDMPYGKEQLIFKLKPEGEILGLSISNIAQQLRMAFDGTIVQIFQEGIEEVDVRLLLSGTERHYLNGLNNLYIRAPKGEFVALSNVVTWTSKQGFEVLRHAEGELAIEVQAEVDATQNNSNSIIAKLKKDALPNLKQKYALNYSLEGRSAKEKDTMSDMKSGLIIGLILMYLILTWVFSSYGWPLVVMSIIPFGLVGAIGGHWLMNIDMTLLSLFGFFGLSGIVVNDSIILVSFYKHLLHKGMESNQALVEASVKRLRAVLLTSLTTIAGLTPLLFETSLQAQFLIPMATSIAFGLIFSTVIVLCIVPVLLSYYHSITTFFSSDKSLPQAKQLTV